jgi:hypothetical protein
MAYKKSNPNGQATSANSEPVVLASDQSAIPVTLTDLTKQVGDTPSATDNGIYLLAQETSFPAETFAPLLLDNGYLLVRNSTLPLPTGAATAALQTQPGVDIGDVTINNASGASAVNIQDGGNSITVDGTVTANISGSIANTSFIATQATGTNLHVVVDSAPTTAVTGTFWQATQPVSLATNTPTETNSGAIKTAVELIDDAIYTDGTGTVTKGIAILGQDGTIPQAIKTDANGELQVDVLTLPNVTIGAALPAGTNNIGDVDVLTLPSLPAGTNNIGDVDIVTMPNVTLNALPTGANTIGAISNTAFTANAGTNLNTSALSLETTQSSINTKTPALGQAVMASSTPVVIASNQTAVPVSFSAASVLFKGRAATFRTPGRAGTAGQNIMAIHNATGSAVTVTVNKIVVDIYQTVVKAITVPPPNIRIWKVTVLPTNGTALAKTKIGGTTTSSASVTVFGDASADGTGSATTLTTTRPGGAFIAQKFASRFITAAGYEPADTIEYLDGSTVTLSALEGLVIFIDYTVATMNPVTDMWTAVVEWSES